MIKATLHLFNGRQTVELQAGDVKSLIRELTFFNELPDECPVCKAPLHFLYDEVEGNDFYRLECDGGEKHSSTLGTYRDESKGLYYKINQPWYTSKRQRSDDPPPVAHSEEPKKQAPPAKTVTHPAPATTTKDRRLTNERAAAMHEELGKLDIKNHYEFATNILDRETKSLTELTEAEALEVWSAAKRQARKANSGRIQDGATYEESFGRN